MEGLKRDDAFKFGDRVSHTYLGGAVVLEKIEVDGAVIVRWEKPMQTFAGDVLWMSTSLSAIQSP
jgi:hypothetical protein